MKKNALQIILVLLLVCGTLTGWTQTLVSGTIQDVATQEGLPGVSVQVKGTFVGAATDVDGNFSFKTDRPFPFTLVITSVGYTRRELIIDFEDQASNIVVFLNQNDQLMDEVVISATRRAEKITESPATVNVITEQDIENLPSFNPGELLARQKGVDFVRSGVLGTGINVRGFNNTFNAKNLQLNDGRFSTLIATGLPLGALTPVVKEDIERVETVLGPSSALYGPNAGNGIINTITKDPRSSEGTTLALGFGAQDVVSTRFRHAQVVSDRFAFKVNGEFTRGTEFDYTDSVYVVGNPLVANPNFNPGLPEGPTNNPTLGVPELELNREFESIKGDASFYYSLNEDADIILSYLGSNSNNLGVSNQGRNQIRDWQIHQIHGRYVSSRWFAQVYHTWSRTDSTYNINQRTINYYNNLAAANSDNIITAQEEQSARANSYANAIFNDHSARWNGEVQYNNTVGTTDFIVGVQVQRDMANSQGTYLLDQDGEIVVDQIGGYLQLEQMFGDNGWKGVLSGRADYHSIYDFNFVPKAALLKIGERGTWRLTYGIGIAAPTILNLEGNLFGGLILGNSEGFTLTDGRQIDALEVERTQTIELGYKGSVAQKLFVDANAYFNISEDFISPLTPLFTSEAVVATRGGEPIANLNPSGVVFTYLNFGEVYTWGADIGLNYYFNDRISLAANYSYFDVDLREDEESNDSNGDGEVDETDLLVNTPNHKASLGLNVNTKRVFGSVFTRWVEAYNFYSGINIAAETNSDIIWDGYPVVEDTPHRRSYNYGPLAGFVNVDVSLGYRPTDNLSVSGQVTNLFDAEVRELVASPFIGRLWSVELKLDIPVKKD